MHLGGGGVHRDGGGGLTRKGLKRLFLFQIRFLPGGIFCRRGGWEGGVREGGITLGGSVARVYSRDTQKKIYLIFCKCRRKCTPSIFF